MEIAGGFLRLMQIVPSADNLKQKNMLVIRKNLRLVLLPMGASALFWLLLFTAGKSLIGELPALPQSGTGNLFYYLIKGSILWVPVGFLFSLIGKAGDLQRWLLSAAVTFVLVAALSGAAHGVWDYMEAVNALIGCWIGVWIGGRTRWVCSDPEIEPETSELPSVARSVRFQSAWLRLPMVLVTLGLTSWAVWSFSRWQIAIGVGLLVYFIILLRFRHAWLFVLPAMLPTLSLAPWTGRLSLDEFDLLMLVTLSGALYHGVHPDSRPLVARPILLLLSGYALVCATAFFIGLFPIPDLDLNSFDNYFSRFNSWTVAKGFLWGFLFLGLVRWTLPSDGRMMERLFVPGLLSGFLAVALVGLRERWQFADLVDFSVPYRITATFYSMHTGGAHLDAYLALIAPIIGYWVVRSSRPWVWAAGLGLFSLAVYLVISTVTRTTFVVLVMELTLLIFFWLKRYIRSRGTSLQGMLAGMLFLAVALPLLYLGSEGSFFQHRMGSVERDSTVRLNHWAKAAGMIDSGFAGQALGMGFGRFPMTYLERYRSGVTPARYDFQQADGNTYVRLYPGQTLYLAQKVAVSDSKRYRLALDVKSRGTNVTVSVPLCEKHLLNSRACNWMSHWFGSGDDQWHHWSIEFDSGEIGKGNWLSRAPVELFLYNPNVGVAIDVDNVSLQDALGTELLNNGTFSMGGDYWFLKTHQHLPWHIKNLWVSALFEQGWLGVTMLSFLLFGLAMYLFGPAWYSGHSAAAVVFVALVGFAATGLFASPFDAPRITTLFFAVLSFGLFKTSDAVVFSKPKSVGD